MSDLDAQLDDLMYFWHEWQLGARVGRGFNSRALVVGDFRNVQVQYDSQLEQTDVDLKVARCRAVDFAVRETEEPWRSALYQDAKNLYHGLSVWTSPRLPKDPFAREFILVEARAMLTGRLISAGVIEEA